MNLSINKVILAGNVGKDAEDRISSKGNKVVTFSLATTESYKDAQGEWQNNTEWHNIVVFGKLAEYLGEIKKGDKVYVEGKKKTREYEGKRYTDIVVDYSGTVKVFDRKTDGVTNSAPVSVETPDGDLPF